MTGVDCHAHADQGAVGKIFVSLPQFFATCVETACHASECSEWPIFMCFHYVCSPFSRYLLPEFWAVLLLRYLLPAVLLRDRYILLRRNQGNGQGTSRQRNSSGRYRSNSSSPHFTSLFFMESFRKSLWSSGRTGSWYPLASRMFSIKSTKCYSISIFWAISAGVSTSPCVYRNSCKSSWYFIAR